VTPGGARSVADVRYELARILGRTAFPGRPPELIDALRRNHAPDALIAPLERLPRSARYGNALELAEAVVGGEGRERNA
jgi:hypothetical protein